jgi:hypothetical protein
VEIYASGPIAVSRCRESRAAISAGNVVDVHASHLWQGKGNDRIAAGGAQTVVPGGAGSNPPKSRSPEPGQLFLTMRKEVFVRSAPHPLTRQFPAVIRRFL